MPAAALTDYLGPLLRGSVVTLEIAGLAMCVALVAAFLAGFARLSPLRPVRWLGAIYVEFFRGTSLLIQMYWFFFALPILGVYMPALVAGVVALGLNIGAYGAEVVRGAVRAVPRGQIEAAVALNLSPAMRMRKVVLPQAVVAMLPPFGNLAIELLKGTALASLITLSDLTFEAQTLRNTTSDTVGIFCLVLVFYFAMAAVITFGFRLLERHVTRYRRGSSAGRLAS